MVMFWISLLAISIRLYVLLDASGISCRPAGRTAKGEARRTPCLSPSAQHHGKNLTVAMAFRCVSWRLCCLGGKRASRSA